MQRPCSRVRVSQVRGKRGLRGGNLKTLRAPPSTYTYIPTAVSVVPLVPSHPRKFPILFFLFYAHFFRTARVCLLYLPLPCLVIPCPALPYHPAFTLDRLLLHPHFFLFFCICYDMFCFHFFFHNRRIYPPFVLGTKFELTSLYIIRFAVKVD